MPRGAERRSLHGGGPARNPVRAGPGPVGGADASAVGDRDPWGASPAGDREARSPRATARAARYPDPAMAPRRRRSASPPSAPVSAGGAAPAADGSLASATSEDPVRELLRRLGEDPAREGLRKTPLRVAQSLAYLTAGAAKVPKDVLNGAVFEHDADEMVVVRDIEVYSLCEHHLLPFFGRAHVAYLPRGKIVGLSKLPRIVDCFARRLQVQERLTMQIAEAVEEILAPAGVGVVIEAAHLCMMMRGVEKQNSRAVTSCMRGRFRTDARTRQEFLQILRGPTV